MTGFTPVKFYGLRVPAGELGVQPLPEFTTSFKTPGFHFTMAAIDPTAPAENSAGNENALSRATLKIRRYISDASDDENDSDDDEALREILNGDLGSDEESDEDGAGPSDPSKTVEKLKAALKAQRDDEDEDVDMNGGTVNGVTKRKGKGKAPVDVAEDSDDEEEDEEEEYEDFVLCTLDPTKNYQQPIDLYIEEDDRVEFFVTGSHDVYLTGQHVLPTAQLGPEFGFPDLSEDSEDEDDDEDEYDLSPGEDELDYDDEEESDELDDLPNPRVKEIRSDEDEAPKLVKADKKGKNKRAADESDQEQDLDSVISKSLKPEAVKAAEPTLSKKQLKKLKNNKGDAVATATETKPTKEGKGEKKEATAAAKDSPAGKIDKKVQFAKNLEQGPTGSPKPEIKSDAKKDEKPKASVGVKTTQGVKIDDRKVGSGPTAKKGNRVSMRYIGKLENGNVFDSNRKGKPFSFKLGAGEVIQGWDIGVEGISVGGERRLTIPASKAYGSKGMPGIPSNSTLIFDIKCMDIK